MDIKSLLVDRRDGSTVVMVDNRMYGPSLSALEAEVVVDWLKENLEDMVGDLVDRYEARLSDEADLVSDLEAENDAFAERVDTLEAELALAEERLGVLEEEIDDLRVAEEERDG